MQRSIKSCRLINIPQLAAVCGPNVELQGVSKSWSYFMSLSLCMFFCSQSKHHPVDRLVRYSHCVADFQTEVPLLKHSLSVLIILSTSFSFCSQFLPVSGTGGLVTFYTWAARAQPLTLARSLTSSTKPRPQVKVCISEFVCEKNFECLCACVCYVSYLNCKERYASLLGLIILCCGVKLPPTSTYKERFSLCENCFTYLFDSFL